MTPQEYTAYESRRQQIIRTNAGRRMAGRSAEQLPVPPKLERPTRVQLSSKAGDYIGTWPFGVSVEDAQDEAADLGERGPYRVKLVPAY